MQKKNMKLPRVLVSLFVIAAISGVAFAGSETDDGGTKGTLAAPGSGSECDYIPVTDSR